MKNTDLMMLTSVVWRAEEVGQTETNNRGATRVDQHGGIRLVVVDGASARADAVQGQEHPIDTAGKACQRMQHSRPDSSRSSSSYQLCPSPGSFELARSFQVSRC